MKLKINDVWWNIMAAIVLTFGIWDIRANPDIFGGLVIGTILVIGSCYMFHKIQLDKYKNAE